MPLETGTWMLNENGVVGPFQITSVDVTGNVSGTLQGKPIVGLWNEMLQKLSFFWAFNDPGTLGPEKLYTGFLFTDSFRMPGIKGGTVFTLAGYFTAFNIPPGSIDRPTFGWYAQIGAA